MRGRAREAPLSFFPRMLALPERRRIESWASLITYQLERASAAGFPAPGVFEFDGPVHGLAKVGDEGVFS